MAMPTPPACPTGHAQPGRPTPSQAESGVTLVRGTLRAGAQFGSEDEHAGNGEYTGKAGPVLLP